MFTRKQEATQESYLLNYWELLMVRNSGWNITYKNHNLTITGIIVTGHTISNPSACTQRLLLLIEIAKTSSDYFNGITTVKGRGTRWKVTLNLEGLEETKLSGGTGCFKYHMFKLNQGLLI